MYINLLLLSHRFHIVEKKKKFNFDINDYPKFKDKIIYLKINKEPDDLYSDKEILSNPIYKRLNSIKRIEWVEVEKISQSNDKSQASIQ